MRWPLRNQLLLRIFVLLFVTIALLTGVTIWSAISNNRKAEYAKANRTTTVLKEFRFPVSQVVLEAMKRLSGAEFVARSQSGDVLWATSGAPTDFEEVGDEIPARVKVVDQYFFVSNVNNIVEGTNNSLSGISLFMPSESDAATFAHASRFPLVVAFAVLPIAFLLGAWFSSHVTKPLAILRSQTDRLASGLPMESKFLERPDEIGELFRTMNKMAFRIREQEEEIRQNERAATILRVGNGIAHNLRNSATGCQMAIEMLAASNQEVQQSEAYEVASRQIELMNTYIKKFLALSKSGDSTKKVAYAPVRLDTLVEESCRLMSPTAKHLNVELQQDIDEPMSAAADADDVRQVMLNLISNGITAANQARLENESDDQATVTVRLKRVDENAILEVVDNGNGPSEEISETLFEPFVSNTREGVGLGLAHVSQIAKQIGGNVNWSRRNGETQFRFDFGNSVGEQA